MILVENIHNGITYAVEHFDSDGNAHMTFGYISGKVAISNENFRKNFVRR